MVWTNEHIMQWLDSIGFRDFSLNIAESGVHGSVFAFDDSFDHNQLALLLQVPTIHAQARQTLEREFNALVAAGTERPPSASAHHAPHPAPPREVNEVSREARFKRRR